MCVVDSHIEANLYACERKPKITSVVFIMGGFLTSPPERLEKKKEKEEEKKQEKEERKEKGKKKNKGKKTCVYI